MHKAEVFNLVCNMKYASYIEIALDDPDPCLSTYLKRRIGDRSWGISVRRPMDDFQYFRIYKVSRKRR